MYLYVGDRLVDANDNVYFRGSDLSKVVFPVKLYHSKCEYYLDTDIVEQKGPEELKGEFKTEKELVEYQDNLW